MKRTDFIENRVDVVKNMYTLYSYVKNGYEQEKEWAIERFKRGKWYVVEPFGNLLFFAPSRFVGYKDNSIEKYTEARGNGVETNNLFCTLKLYKKVADNYLSEQFEKFMEKLGVEKNTANFFISYDLEISDLKKPHQCYFVSPTHCAKQKESAWKNFLNKAVMAIGWKDIDYTNYSNQEIEEDYIDDTAAIPAFILIKQIQEGDIICCTNNGHGLWGIGVAMSSYKYQQKIHYAGKDENDRDSYYSHYIDVAWLCFREQGYIPTWEFNIQFPEKQWQPYSALTMKDMPLYISNYLLKNTNDMENSKKCDKYISLLEVNRNLIFTGAPGTGKTYLAKKIAEEMNAEFDFVQFHPSYDYTDFVEGLRPTRPDKNGNIGFERRDGVFKRFCIKAIQEKQEPIISNTHKDALGLFKNELEKHDIEINSFRSDTIIKTKLRKNGSICVCTKSEVPISDQKMLKYLVDGECNENDTYTKSIGEYIINNYMFKVETCKDDKPLRKYLFIIDEINRGEISKIFGELFFSIDPSYRGKKVLIKTQYQNLITDKSDPFYEGFYVPENVYIIGTMNDIDRSVESMDFAMRRRFAWEEIKANENTEMLDGLGGEMKDEVVSKMKRLNSIIWDEKKPDEGIEGLNAAYHIGGAYFMKLILYLEKDGTTKEDAYKKLWENHLRGVLFEYLRGTANAADILKKLEDTYYQEDENKESKG
jgi:GTPase subunit of restriction endonuclease